MHSWRKVAAPLAGLLLVVGLAACGSDDDDPAVGGADDTEEAVNEDDEHEGAEGEDEDAEAEDHEEAMGGNPCAPGASTDEFPEAEELDADATPVTITAVEYEFQGAEALAAGGTFGITFENEGNELHELVIVRLAEGEDRPIEELIEAEEEPDLTDVAFAVACPGDSTTLNADIGEPGRYVALCFVPVGSTPEATQESEGPPHASQGMVYEFEIA